MSQSATTVDVGGRRPGAKIAPTAPKAVDHLGRPIKASKKKLAKPTVVAIKEEEPEEEEEAVEEEAVEDAEEEEGEKKEL